MKNRLLIYGATGYTGRLIAQEAARRVRRARLGASSSPAWANLPLLAGRNPAVVKALADELELPWIAVGLDDNAALDRALAEAAVVLNAAGPFQVTATPLAKACLRTRTHYLDVSGAMETFQRLDDYNVGATSQDVLIMPGVGFNVAATDVLVGLVTVDLKEQLDLLRVAMSRVDFVSRGSMRTLQETARQGAAIRRSGKLETVPVGRLERNFQFATDGDETICTAVRLADLVTAPITTHALCPALVDGVPNIETYVEAAPLNRIGYQAMSAFALPLQMWPLRQMIDAQLRMWPDGPSQADRDSIRQTVLVEGEDRYRSRIVRYRLTTPDVYEFTAWSAISIAEMVMNPPAGKEVKGFKTPASLFCAELHQLFWNDRRLEGTCEEIGLRKYTAPGERTTKRI